MREKVGGVGADEGARDDAADVERIAETPRDFAQRIEPFEAERLLMRGDLQHGIGRRVANRLQTAQMFLAEFLDDSHARGVLVSKDARKARLGDQRLGEVGRESRNGLTEIAPLEPHRRSSDFPMARGRVFPERRFDSITPLAGGLAKTEAGRGRAGGGLHRVAEAEAIEIGQFERAGAQAGAVAATLRAGLHDMAKRVGAGVAIGRGVFGAAAANRVEHDDDRASYRLAHWGASLTASRGSASILNAAANNALV